MKLSQLEALVAKMRRCATAMNIQDPNVTFWEDDRAKLEQAIEDKPVFITFDFPNEVANLPASGHVCPVDMDDVKRGDFSIPITVVPTPGSRLRIL